MKATGFFAQMAMAIVAITTLLFISCNFNAIQGSGNVTTENRPVIGDFKKVDASHGLDVIIEQAPTASITVEADDNVQKHIHTEISNGVLRIWSNINSYTDVTKTIKVKMPIISGIEVSSGAMLSSQNMLKTASISVKTSSGADAKVAVEAEKATCETSSGSHISISGKAIDLETAASSGSGIDAEKLLSNNITSSVSSGSTTDVHPLVSLNAEASSGGVINYHNVPKTISKKSGSGGVISEE